jgi:hypothetical protein
MHSITCRFRYIGLQQQHHQQKHPLVAMRKKKRRKRDFLPVQFAYTVVSHLRRVLEMAHTPIRLSPRFEGFTNQSSPKEETNNEL